MAKISGIFRFFFSQGGFVKFYALVFTAVILFILTACRTPPKIDMRKFAPIDAVIYLESNNFAAMLESLTESPAFQELAADKVDFSALENIQIAVVVTDFETSEKQGGGESSILNFKPKFVAIAETRAWSWQTLSLAENQINNFVVKNFGQETRLEKIDKNDGKFFTWTTTDGREIYAFVQNSLIYFGNDAAAIEKCLSVKNGNAESLLKNESLARNYSADNLAFGYISPAGIARIASLAGVGLAVQTTEESDERNFIARILPQILQNTTKQIIWTANKTERGIEDKFTIALNPEVSSAINQNPVAPIGNRKHSIEFLPSEIFSATSYDLKNPSAAWRDLLSLAAQNADSLSSKLLMKYSDALLEPYGISSAELFLDSIDREIITARFDEEGEKSLIIADVKDAKNLKKSISSEIKFNLPPTKLNNAEIWFSDDKNIAAAFVENKLILGDGESVLKCLQAGESNRENIGNQRFQKFSESHSLASTFGKDVDSAAKIVGVLARKKSENKKPETFYLTETNLNENGFERKTVSDFGLIGTFLKQMAN